MYRQKNKQKTGGVNNCYNKRCEKNNICNQMPSLLHLERQQQQKLTTESKI